jgi:hypothetical protein
LKYGLELDYIAAAYILGCCLCVAYAWWGA